MAVRRWVIGIVAVLAIWVGGYALLSRDPDTVAYREMCVRSAQSAVDGLGTARLATDDGLPAAYQKVLKDDARTLIAQARSEIAVVTPPDSASARRRETLLPLLNEAEQAYLDLTRARTADTERQAAQHMAALAELLRAFIEGNR